MEIKKYKYYFRKPKSEIVKDVLAGLLITGAISVAATSPYFVNNLLKNYGQWKKYPKKKTYNAFYLLRKQGCINFEKQNHQIYISLTEKGKKKAGMFQIDSLKINRPKIWDKKWRIIIFDIAELKKIFREAFRGKLKELGFYPLQKSVWVFPFGCQAEIDLLKDFFGLSNDEIKLITAEKISNDNKLKEIFKLN